MLGSRLIEKGKGLTSPSVGKNWRERTWKRGSFLAA